MLKIQKIITVFFLTATISCSNNYLHKDFIYKYKLNKYDTIYITSSVSCGGCIDGFYQNKKFDSNSILVYNETSTNEYIKNLLKYKHVNIPQEILDKEFDYFSNVLILSKKGDKYEMSVFPEYKQ